MSKPNYIIGLDIGNGAIKSSVRHCGEYIDSLFFPKYAYGKKNLDALDRDGVATYGINPAINGNTDDLYIVSGGEKCYLGLSAHTVDGHIIRETGYNRYSDIEHLQNMLTGSYKGLCNGGWTPENAVEVDLCVGLPPLWFYNDKKYNDINAHLEDAFLDKNFKVKLGDDDDAVVKHFNVTDLVVMSEAIGGYFSYVYDYTIDGDFELVQDPSVGTLIIDIGYGTTDGAIIKDFGLGSIDELLTAEELGCHDLFSRAVSELDDRYNDFDELELLFNTGQSRLDLSKVVLKSKITRSASSYLKKVRSRIVRKYVHSQRTLFSDIIVIGGITKLVSKSDLERAFTFNGKKPYIGDEFFNVHGYEKLLRNDKYGS